MTDYRLRNHDLLSADRGFRPLGWRSVAIFGSIAATVTFSVAGYLSDRFVPATAGLHARSVLMAQRQTDTPPIQLVSTPGRSDSGAY